MRNPFKAILAQSEGMRNCIRFLFLCCFPFTMLYGQSLNDLVITEIMADPSPSVGLPETEYLELYNRTDKPVSLKGWKLAMATRSVVLPDSAVPPLSYVVLCNRNSLSLLSKGNGWVGLSTFLLPNDGAVVSLYSPRNQLIHSVSYTVNWWPPGKRDGGYAIEMIDAQHPCMERGNWLVSRDPSGGTPGRANGVMAILSDNAPPLIEQLNVLSETELSVVFNKRLDSLSAVKGSQISLPGRSIVKRNLIAPAFTTLLLSLDSPLQKGQIYSVTISNMADCGGNILREVVMNLGIPEKADSGDVVINEILFNPLEGGVDFVELINRSSKFISIRDWNLANMNDGKTDGIRVITKDAVTITPNGFLALTIDPAIVAEQYPAGKSSRFLQVTAMPAFPNEQGGVVVLDGSGKAMDEFQYSEKMHHPLLSNLKGVSLERLDPGKPTSDPGNWHSASSVAGYATPGYANSQVQVSELENDFWLIPDVFTPDMDGMDDVVSINYSQRYAGAMATIRIFDVNGRLVRTVLRNQLIGGSGKIDWDGTDERRERVRTGHYFVVIETFDIYGNTRQFKKKVVAATDR